MASKGNAEWQGDLKTGHGRFTAGDDLSGDYSFTSRFEDGPGANPEQLIGAALAACFSMALSNQLAQAGTPVESVKTDAVVSLRNLGDGPSIASIALTTVGRVPGVDPAEFQRQAEATRTGCIVSRALAAVPEITLDASLAD